MTRTGGPSGLLNSWKDVANYLGWSIRTVQRREKNGLPVRRIGTGPRSSVVAYVAEIDQWLKSLRMGSEPNLPPDVLQGRIQSPIERSRVLRRESRRLLHRRRVIQLQLLTNLTSIRNIRVVLPPRG